MGSDREERMPQLIAFDLDYTLWDFWIDTHVTAPLTGTSSGVVDKEGTLVEFYPDVPDILKQLRTSAADTKIAVCSRSHAPALAREALSLITIPLSRKEGEEERSAVAQEFFDELEIYPGSKLAHFKSLHRRTGIPYSEMLFFDDESRNREVERLLGVTFILVPSGMNNKIFQAGLKEWRKRTLDCD